MESDVESFYYVCGKCRSRNLYRDRDRIAGDTAIACRSCGNRYFGELRGKGQGAAPIKIHYTPEPEAPAPEPHFTTERTAGILIGPRRPPAHMEEKEEVKDMKGDCTNCERKEITIVSKGRCFTCYKAANGLEGEELAASLAAVAERIKGGGLRRTGKSGNRKAKTAETATAIGKAAQTGPAPSEIKWGEATSGADYGRELAALAKMVILTDLEWRFIEAFRAGRIALIGG